MMQQQALLSTELGSKIIERLCKHFAHKVQASFDEHQGEIHFAEGSSYLSYDGALLRIVCQAPSAPELADIIDTIDRHFLRLAKAANAQLSWQAVV